MGDSEKAVISLRSAMSEFDASDWDACAGPDNPFLKHTFLQALEESGSARRETGWTPSHLALTDEAGTLLGAVPMYLKSHSQGEYVFDHQWAAAYRARRRTVLSEAARRRALHARDRPSPPRPSRPHGRRRARASSRRLRRFRTAVRRFLGRHQFPDRGGMEVGGPSRLAPAHRPAVPLGKSRLRLLRRFSRRPGLAQTQEPEEGAAARP